MAYHVFKKRAYDFDIFYDVLQCKTLSKYRKIDNVTRGHYWFELLNVYPLYIQYTLSGELEVRIGVVTFFQKVTEISRWDYKSPLFSVIFVFFVKSHWNSRWNLRLDASAYCLIKGNFVRRFYWSKTFWNRLKSTFLPYHVKKNHSTGCDRDTVTP